MVILLRILLALLFAFLVSALYKFLCVFFIICTFKKELRIPKSVLITLLSIGVFFSTPRYNTGKLRLMYDDKGELVSPSLFDYFIDCIIPEEEAMNVGTTCFRCSSFLFKNSSDWIIKTAYNDRKHLSDFVKPYSDIRNNVMSGVWGQLHNKKTLYIQYPENKNAKLVVFCHGYAGNWKMYQGVLSKLSNCVVLTIGTSDISGIYNKSDISKVFTEYIPYLEEKGYTIKGIDIIGLSNGVSAINTAIKWFPTQFDSYTAVSGNLSHVSKVAGSINFIGGANDSSSNKMLQQHFECRKIRVKSLLYYPKDDHFLLVNRKDEVLQKLEIIINDTQTTS